MSAKQLNIHSYMERRYAQTGASFSNGKYKYKGLEYTPKEFEDNFGTKWVEQVTSINFPPTAKNPDKTKID